MSNKISLIKFIDRRNYTSLLDKNFSIDNLIDNLNNPLSVNDNLSALTKYYILYLNIELPYILFNDNYFKTSYTTLLNNNLSTNELAFIRNKFNEELNTVNSLKNYYELVVLPSNDILVVVEEGFLNHITESKNNLLKFILHCLCHQYKFKFELKILLNSYIKLKMNDNYFNLLKLKAC